MDDSETSRRLLFLLKTKGPCSTTGLAEAMAITPEATRQQVQRLLGAGLIAGQQEASTKAGRPRRTWTLTDAGNAKFPETHAQVAVQLIGAVRELFGEEGLERLIAQREAEVRIVYSGFCNGATLEARLGQLAEIRSNEGYMAHVARDGDGWILTEDHCPICAAASACQGFCRSELNVFQFIVGSEGRVVRERHLLSGARHCSYRITPGENGR